MKKITVIFGVLFLLLSNEGLSQKSGQTDFEIGLNGGVSWYNGDLNPNIHFGRDYMSRAFGLSLRRNLNQRFAWRWQFNYGTLYADDADADFIFQQNRNLNFQSPIYELATTIEFNFLSWDALIPKHIFSPYTFIGLAGFHFNPSTSVEGAQYDLQPLATEGKAYSRFNVAVPFGFGFKLAITDRFIISADWGLRRTFSDYLDDVSTMYPEADEISGLPANISDRSLSQTGPDGSNWGTQRGNSLTKDWYSFAMFTISVRLGPKKGSCKHLRI